MADAYGFVGALLRRLRYRDNGDNSYSPLVSLGPGQPAAYVGWASATSPATATSIVQSGTLAAGRYRIVATAASDDSSALASARNVQLVWTTGGQAVIAVAPCGAQARWEIPDVSLDAGTRVTIRNGAAASAGANYYGWLAVYPLP